MSRQIAAVNKHRLRALCVPYPDEKLTFVCYLCSSTNCDYYSIHYQPNMITTSFSLFAHPLHSVTPPPCIQLCQFRDTFPHFLYFCKRIKISTFAKVGKKGSVWCIYQLTMHTFPFQVLLYVHASVSCATT